MIFRCTLQIFSGKKNPTWAVEDETNTASIENLLRDAQLSNSQSLNNSRLGYTGVRLQSENTTWEIYDRIIEKSIEGSEPIRMNDANRRIEKLILKTAPQELFELVSPILKNEF